MLYLTSWLFWKFSSKIALMTAGWQSCSCLDLNGKTRLEFESVALKWNCLLKAELSHRHSSMNEGRGRGRGCAILEGRLWGALSQNVPCPVTLERKLHCTSLNMCKEQQLQSGFFLEGALLGLGVAGTGHWAAQSHRAVTCSMRMTSLYFTSLALNICPSPGSFHLV